MIKKQILFMIDSLTCGGAEKSLVSLLPLLDYTMIEVDLMMVNRGGVFERYVPKTVEFVGEVGLGEVWLGKWRFSLQLRWNKLIGKKVHGAELQWKCLGETLKPLEKEYDVAIAYQQGFPTYYVAEKVTAKMKIAWVNADITKVGYRAEFNRPYYDKFDWVVPVSDKLCSILYDSGFVDAKKLYTILDILNVELIRQMANDAVFDLPAKSRLTLCTTGRMVALKGYDLAVETARIIKSKGINFIWYFVGDGNERPKVESLIAQYGLQENILLMGMLPNPYPYMAVADIYVQTSRFEGFGLTIAEAKILGKPVVSTNFDVVYDQIEHEKNGLIAQMNPESMADSILRLVNDQNLRKIIEANVMKEENTTYLTEVKKVEKLLESDF